MLAGNGVDFGLDSRPLAYIHSPITEVYSCMDTMGFSEVAKSMREVISSSVPVRRLEQRLRQAARRQLTYALLALLGATLKCGLQDGEDGGRDVFDVRAGELCGVGMSTYFFSAQHDERTHPIRSRTPCPSGASLLEHVVKHAHADCALCGSCVARGQSEVLPHHQFR